MKRAALLGVLMLAAGPLLAAQIIHVPGDVASLQTAINSISNGGIIEIASGTYTAPSGGFVATNLHKSFTIRAAAGATVVLDGANANAVFKLMNSSPTAGGPVVFQGLTFYRGRSLTDGLAGGFTLSQADATFLDCVFQACWSDAPTTGGGGGAVFTNSRALFLRCQWLDNWATNEGGGLRVASDSVAWIHDSQFLRNRCNLPGHRPSAAGGGIHVGDANVRLTNTRLQDNQAGYVGGGLLLIGTWVDPVTVPHSHAYVANCTFVDNQAINDPSVNPPAPTEAGGMHAEDQSQIQAYNSRFVTNSAQDGGGVNLYRAKVELENCVLQGNRATDTVAGTGFGAAMSAISNDTYVDGANNWPSAQLEVRHTLVQGRYGTVTTVGQIGGGLEASGDSNRRFGLNGVSPTAPPSETRASVTIDDVVFADLDVQQTAGISGTGNGGAMEVGLTNLTMSNSLVAGCDAVGAGTNPDTSAGGVRLIIEAVGSISSTLIVKNTAHMFGAGLYTQGCAVNISGSTFAENALVGSPGYGTAMLSGPLTYYDAMNATGIVSNTIFSNNNGLPIYDADGTTGPYNDERYNGNQIYRSGSTQIYTDDIVGTFDVPGLNSLVVYRTGSSTDKSQIDNVALGAAPVVGAIHAVPAQILPTIAAGDTGSQTRSYLGYGWSGGSATLDGSPVTGNWGLLSAGVGSHNLTVAGTPFSASITEGPTPAAVFAANPAAISSGQSSTLSWTVTYGTYLDVGIDQGVSITPAASGSVVVSPTVTTTYRLAAVTKEGGVVVETTVWVGEFNIFSDGFESGSTSAWSATQH